MQNKRNFIIYVPTTALWLCHRCAVIEVEYITSHTVFFFVEYLPQSGWKKRPKITTHLYIIVSNYSEVFGVCFSIYIYTRVTAQIMDKFKYKGFLAGSSWVDNVKLPSPFEIQLLAVLKETWSQRSNSQWMSLLDLGSVRNGRLHYHAYCHSSRWTLCVPVLYSGILISFVVPTQVNMTIRIAEMAFEVSLTA